MRPDTHAAEEELILLYYREPGSDALERHLSGCDLCRQEYARLRATMDLVADEPVPERGDDYGADVWRRLSPRLPHRETTKTPMFSTGRRWALAASVALMVVSAFLAGRFSRTVETPAPVAAEIPTPVRERILLVALGDHVERSQMMLVELLNADGGATVDLSTDRKRAEELVADSRIYRQSAAISGDAAMAVLLEELERVLLDIAHGPDTLTHAELEAFQRRINERGILLKVRLIGSQLRQKEKSAAAGTAGRRA